MRGRGYIAGLQSPQAGSLKSPDHIRAASATFPLDVFSCTEIRKQQIHALPLHTVGAALEVVGLGVCQHSARNQARSCLFGTGRKRALAFRTRAFFGIRTVTRFGPRSFMKLSNIQSRQR